MCKNRVVEFQFIDTGERHATVYRKYGSQVLGTLTGWDRLVLRGSLRRLNYGWWDERLQAFVAKGMEEYLWQNKALFKDYAEYVKQVSEQLKKESLNPFYHIRLCPKTFNFASPQSFVFIRVYFLTRSRAWLKRFHRYRRKAGDARSRLSASLFANSYVTDSMDSKCYIRGADPPRESLLRPPVMSTAELDEASTTAPIYSSGAGRHSM